MLMSLDKLLGHGEGDGDLADAGGSNDAEKALSLELLHEITNDLGAADQAGQKSRQIVPAPCWRHYVRRGPQLYRYRNCRDKAVATTRNIDQIPIAAMAVAQRP